jgi:Spy/CpxP family protein refolding chaperone
MNRPRLMIGVTVVSVAMAVAAAGCGASVADGDTAAAAQAAAKAKGPVAGVKAAVTAIARADQRAKTDQLFADVEAKLHPVADARRGLMKEIAAGVRAGRIDRSKTDAKVGEITAAVEAARPTVETSLNTLHATFDADQRADLLEALHDAFQGRRGERGAQLREIAEELQLSEDQRDRIKDAVKAEFMAKRGEHKARLSQLRDNLHDAADAFESDQFDARSFELAKHAPEIAKTFSQGMVRAIELSMPLLTAPQRDKLAAILDRKAAEIE